MDDAARTFIHETPYGPVAFIVCSWGIMARASPGDSDEGDDSRESGAITIGPEHEEWAGVHGQWQFAFRYSASELGHEAWTPRHAGAFPAMRRPNSWRYAEAAPSWLADHVYNALAPIARHVWSAHRSMAESIRREEWVRELHEAEEHLPEAEREASYWRGEVARLRRLVKG